MNSIDLILFVFDVSNTVAVKGSIDSIHTFMDYYEDFYENYKNGLLTGMDKTYVDRLIVSRGGKAVEQALETKKMCIVFNRSQKINEVTQSLDQLREYLDTLGKYEKYRDRIYLVGLIPNNKVINITNNRGSLF